jgi:hypothetical protein
MRKLILSDHVNDKVTEAKKKRDDEFNMQYQRYCLEVSNRKACINSCKGEIAFSWRNADIAAVFYGIYRYIREHIKPGPIQPTLRAAGEEEEKWNSGSEGERRVADYLAAHLSDDWTMVFGYYNAKGEIDQLLVGPRGIFAIEIKNVNGVVHCDGDQWWRDKYDNYGNLLEINLPMADKGGRGPSRQLNEPTNLLQSHINKKLSIGRIQRAVILSHNKSRPGALANITVDVVATIHNFDYERMIARQPNIIEAITVDKILMEIRKHHDDFKSSPRRMNPTSAHQQ